MSDKDTITLPREVVEQLLKMLEMVEPYADQLTDYSSTAAEWPLNLLPKKVSEAITALRTHLTAEPKQEPVAKAWAEGYQQGVKDERTSEASIGIAGFGAKVEPARQNPYGTALAAEQPKPEPVRCNPAAMRTAASSSAVLFITELDSPEDEALRRDAERFRWLRENAAGLSGETLDAAIDAEMGDKR